MISSYLSVARSAVVGLAMTAFLGACTATGGTTTSDRLATVSSLTGTATTGEGLYTSQCAVCHGVGGQGGSGPRVVGANESSVIDAMLQGPSEMPTFGTLSDQQIADIAAFVIQM